MKFSDKYLQHIANEQGRIVALSNFLVPRYQISVLRYTITQLSAWTVMLGLIYFLFQHFFGMAMKEFHYSPHLADFKFPPSTARQVLAFIYYSVFGLIGLGSLNALFSIWRQADIIRVGNAIKVKLKCCIDTPFKYRIAVFVDAKEGRFSFFSYQVGISNEINIKGIIDPEKLYTCYKGSSNAGCYRNFLIILDENEFERIRKV